MDLVNRQYIHHLAPRRPPGVLVVPLARTYFARLVHAAFRCFNQPTPTARETHVHDVYHVILVTDGRGHFVVEGQLIPADAGLVVLTGPGEPHSFFNAPGENVEFCEVTFEFHDAGGALLLKPFHEMLGAWTGSACRPPAVGRASPTVHVQIMQEIERIVRVGFAQEGDVSLMINDALGRILLAVYSDLRAAATAGKDPLRQVHEHIHRHYQRTLGLWQLARIAGVSPNYLSRRFKDRFGTTPLYYQRRLRSQIAADLLRTTDHPIPHIAEATGYGDVFSFSRAFRRWQGSPPAMYRRNARMT
ncbi:MAG: helix-turn-helix transcriptional regulator [Planctomycetes bacterium]|nr:helix-turn-helix transcriptional regulator [Planctomycetota bacterium]